MPEQINIANIEYASGYIDNNGNIGTASTSWYSSNIFLLPGKYKIKVISNTYFSGSFAARVHRYNLSDVWQEMLLRYSSTAPTPENKIWTFEINIAEPSYIKLSIRYSLSLLEIEKL